MPGTAGYGTQLQRLLADPLMAPLAAAPGLRRMLNSLCQMLGVPKPPPLPSPRPAAVAPRLAMTDEATERPAANGPPPFASPNAA